MKTFILHFLLAIVRELSIHPSFVVSFIKRASERFKPNNIIKFGEEVAAIIEQTVKQH